MNLKSLELSGFKSFGKKESLDFNTSVSAIVGPNGSGKSNIAEAFRFVLGEQSIKSLRGKKGEDLIWGGGKNVSRANRASVKVVFENSSKLFDVDFDEVSLERIVHRDGVNQYFINTSQVRLKDIAELLAGANIGSSGHHIISQGEADRILNANPKERREMIEDALGLKIYHYKLAESEKKLQKTLENISQVETLRKEIAPHLRFLKKQVERVEKTRQIREDLKKLYQEYLKRESIYLSWWREKNSILCVEPNDELVKLEKALAEVKKVLEQESAQDGKSEGIIKLEEELRLVRGRKDVLAREIGGLEGELRAEERRVKESVTSSVNTGKTVPLSVVKTLIEDVRTCSEGAENTENILTLREIISNIREKLNNFIRNEGSIENITEQEREVSYSEKDLIRLQEENKKKEAEYQNLTSQEVKLQEEYARLKKEIDTVQDKGREAERSMFTIISRQNELRVVLDKLHSREKILERESESFEHELKEGGVLVGRAVLSYEDYVVVGSSGSELSDEVIASEDRTMQDKRKHEIEKIKIRLEEFGKGGGEDVIKEYREIEEREQFLAREIVDLEGSAETLVKLSDELTGHLREQFKDGIYKINKEFTNFFSMMFGGGTASLSVVHATRRKSASDPLFELSSEEEVLKEEVPEEGIDISVSIPHKRTKGLVMLSGGERALTSIALLFAMSQVNPPPFLILDETDAALDEANSKRYGDMIENLSKYSQLILITHNRETMSRANIIYGVTMGENGASKLLSVKFDEAVKVAK